MGRGRRSLDLTGLRFGRFTAVRPTAKRFNSYVVWFVRCDCGATDERAVYQLKPERATGNYRLECQSCHRKRRAERKVNSQNFQKRERGRKRREALRQAKAAMELNPAAGRVFTPRNQRIALDYIAGATLRQLAAKYGLRRQRIHQIVGACCRPKAVAV